MVDLPSIRHLSGALTEVPAALLLIVDPLASIGSCTQIARGELSEFGLNVSMVLPAKQNVRNQRHVAAIIVLPFFSCPEAGTTVIFKMMLKTLTSHSQDISYQI